MIFEVQSPGPPDSWDRAGARWSYETYNQFCLAISWTDARFRSIILSTPHCWTQVSIAADDFYVNSAWPAMLLSRSRNRGFDLAITVGDDDMEWYSWTSLRDSVLKTHIARCRSLTVVGVKGELRPCVDLLGDFDLPCLTMLSLHQTSHYHESAIDILPDLKLPRTPLLALSLIDDDYEKCHGLESLRFTSMKRLHISVCVDHIWFRNTLAECSALEHLWWDCFEMDDPEAYTGSAVLVLSRLLSLRLQEGAILAFPPLKADRLEQMILVGDHTDYEESPRPAFLNARPTHFPSLRRFACTMSAFTMGRAFKRFILRHPNLEDISVIRYVPHPPEEIEDSDSEDDSEAEGDDGEDAGSPDASSDSRTADGDLEAVGSDSDNEDDNDNAEEGDKSDEDDSNSEHASSNESEEDCPKPFDWFRSLLWNLASRDAETADRPPLRLELDSTSSNSGSYSYDQPNFFATNGFKTTLGGISEALDAVPKLVVHVASHCQPDSLRYQFRRPLQDHQHQDRFAITSESKWKQWPDAWRLWYGTSNATKAHRDL